ncbi:hypothetical protein MARVELLAND_23 [Bacillus phage vB_BspM_MarvelLand]|nr:hypothetical protein MARVELLAND_23 [Bacillus phage vB_BspM_MarvelLand]
MILMARPKEHGMSNHRLHTIWRHMRQRCMNPKDRAYENYGGKGVSICSEWDTFSEFMHWALTNGYAEGLTIDRLDSNGDYEPNNCEWVTRSENTRRARTGKPSGNRGKPITFQGKTQYLTEWAEELGVSYITLYKRLNKAKMPVDVAFAKKVQKRK